MPIYLQEVRLPENCFLNEVLLWVVFQRLPIASYDLDGTEVHEAEDGEHSPDIGHSEISDDECRRAGIPPDPSYAMLFEETLLPDPLYFDRFLENNDLELDLRAELIERRNAAANFQTQYKAWRQHFEQAIAHPVAQIFVALKKGSLQATGQLVIGSEEEGNEEVSTRDNIPATFWTMRGIDFENSAASNGSDRYKRIMVSTANLLALFSGERSEVSGVHRIGDSFVLDEISEPRRPPSSLAHTRGRPAYPWERFHLEVADLLSTGGLPEKKEAAIQYFQSWFEHELKVRPSRAAIGEKLTPYYERFVRRTGQKSAV